MLYFQKALFNAIVHKKKSMVTCILCMLIVMLFQTYISILSSNERQLNYLAEVMPVQAKILNLNGSQEVNLDIKDQIIEKLQSLPYVYNESFTVQTNAGIAKFSSEESQKYLKFSVLAANNVKAVTDLSEKHITWEEGYSSAFFQQDKEKCIINENVMKNNNWKLGDKISLTQYYYKYGLGYEMEMNPLETTSFEIVGYVQVSEDENFLYDFLIPFKAERNIYLRNSIPFSANSASFYVNPLKLNDFKEEMDKMHLLQVEKTADFSHAGIALSVRDSSFIVAASQLRQSIDVLMLFFPFILIIMIGIGYIASFLLLQGRRDEIAIMRSIGLSSKTCFFIMVMEHFIVALIGVMAGSTLALIWMSSKIWMICAGVALVLGCYMAGTCAAMWKTGRISVMEALTRVD